MTRLELVRKFKQHGYKITPQRRAILGVIAGPISHPTAEEIYELVRERMPDTSLATVYNTLRELVTIGEAYELILDCGVRRYELTGTKHAHLVCLQCGRIQDLFVNWAELESLLCPQDGFRPVRYDVTIYGYCADCASPPEGGLC